MRSYSLSSPGLPLHPREALATLSLSPPDSLINNSAKKAYASAWLHAAPKSLSRSPVPQRQSMLALPIKLK